MIWLDVRDVARRAVARRLDIPEQLPAPFWLPLFTLATRRLGLDRVEAWSIGLWLPQAIRSVRVSGWES